VHGHRATPANAGKPPTGDGAPASLRRRGTAVRRSTKLKKTDKNQFCPFFILFYMFSVLLKII
jgi:hypothetical protein